MRRLWEECGTDFQAKYTPHFTQSPSGQQTAHFRSTISSNLGSLSAAAASDNQLNTIWREIQSDVGLLSQGESGLRQQAQQVAAGKAAPVVPSGTSLLDLDDNITAPKGGLEEHERAELSKAISEVQQRLDRLGKLRRERDDVLKDLKDKVQNDDVSNLLLLNRRSQNVEPQLFASELEKFKPFQSRLAAAIHTSSTILQELEMFVRQVEKGKGVKERQKGSKERQKRVKEWEQKLERAGQEWAEIKAGAGKGLSFYESLTVILNDLGSQVRSFVKNRESERNRMVSEIEARQRIGSSPSPPVPSQPTSRGLDSQLAGLSLGGGSRYGSPAVPSQSPYGGGSASTPSLPPPPSSSTPAFPPPPPPQKTPANSAYDFSSLSSLPSSFSTSSPSQSSSGYPAPPQPQSSQSPYSYPSYPPPSSQAPQSSHGSNPYPPAPPRSSQPSYGYTSPPPQQQYGQTQSSHSSYGSAPHPPAHPAYPAPPPRQSSTSYYPPPGQSAPSPAPPQAQGYPNYPPPSSHYASPPPQSYAPPQSQQVHHQSSYPPPSGVYGQAPPGQQQQYYQGQGQQGGTGYPYR